MPLVSTTKRETVEKQYKLLSALEAECVACRELSGEKPDLEYIYEEYDMDKVPKTACIAVAQYNASNTYAVYAPADLPESHLSIFELFLREVKEYAEAGDRIIVFSQRDYDAIIKYSYGTLPADVILYRK